MTTIETTTRTIEARTVVAMLGADLLGISPIRQSGTVTGRALRSFDGPIRAGHVAGVSRRLR